MIKFKEYSHQKEPNLEEKETIITFLHTHLDEFGDSKSAIEKALNYSLEEGDSSGGFTLVASINDEITGAVILNRTGMSDYIPENILVYIATHGKYRGKGIGKALVEKTIALAEGGIALHVEPNNPARFLYEKFGFTNKYLEMRLQVEK